MKNVKATQISKIASKNKAKKIYVYTCCITKDALLAYLAVSMNLDWADDSMKTRLRISLQSSSLPNSTSRCSKINKRTYLSSLKVKYDKFYKAFFFKLPIQHRQVL